MKFPNFIRSHVGSVVACLAGTALVASSARAGADQDFVYFGTYTGGLSKGIYVSRLDLETGRLSEPELAAEVQSPSFLALHPRSKFLYAVNEVSDFQGKKTGAVSAFAIERATGRLQLLNQQPSIGDGPCHLVVDDAGRHVIVANYGGGSTTVLPLEKDGRLGPFTDFIQHKGSSVNPQRQQGPHAHCATLDPANRFAFITDLGLDQVLIFKYDAQSGLLTPNHPASAAVRPGAGPRHFAFDPAGRYGYVINEIDCTMTAFSYNRERGALTTIETVSTLRPGETVQAGYSTAEVEVHPGGRFLYGSNRGHDTIVAYGIDPASGRLRLIEHESTQGRTPRSFGIDPSGRWFLAANQDSDNVVVFSIDGVTGELKPTHHAVTVGRPVCVKFLPAR